MPITNLKNSLETSAAYAEAVYTGMSEWSGDPKAIRVQVKGIQAPTFFGSNPGQVDGCCLTENLVPAPVLLNMNDLLDRQEKLVEYLKFLAENA